MSVLLPDLASVRVHETASELVVEVDVPPSIELHLLATHLRNGVLTIRLPRARTARHIRGFDPNATPV
jgi:hypothetical protein